jgi:hypothetical protein
MRRLNLRVVKRRIAKLEGVPKRPSSESWLLLERALKPNL